MVGRVLRVNVCVVAALSCSLWISDGRVQEQEHGWGDDRRRLTCGPVGKQRWWRMIGNEGRGMLRGGGSLSNLTISVLSRSRAQQQRASAGPQILNQSATEPPQDARVLQGIAPPSGIHGPRGSCGLSLGSKQFPAPGSCHPGRTAPQKGRKSLPKRCSICYSTAHGRTTCPDAMLSEIESGLDHQSAESAPAEVLCYRLLGASKTGSVTEVEEAVAAGADVNEHDKQGLLDSALHRAAYWGHSEVAKLLLQRGAHVSPRNRLDYTPLHWAAVRGQTDMVEVLLAACADVRASDMEGNTPLHFAAREGFPEIAQRLLAAGAQVNALTGVWCFTPLMYAAMRGQTACVLLLASHNADLALRCGKGLNACEWAVALCRRDCGHALSRLMGCSSAPAYLNAASLTPELSMLQLLGLLQVQSNSSHIPENAVEEAGESDYGSGKKVSEFWGNEEEEREGGACRELAGGRNNYNKEEDGQVSKRFRAEGGAGGGGAGGGGAGGGRGRGRGEERAGSSESHSSDMLRMLSEMQALGHADEC